MSVRYLHTGIPTNKKMPGESYLDALKLYVTDPDRDPYHVEYVRFTAETLLPPSVQFATHVAYEVDNLEEELKQFDQVLFAPFDLGELVVAFAKKDETVFELSVRK